MTPPASVESPAEAAATPAQARADAASAPADRASGAPADAAPVDEPESLASEVARRRLGERLRRIAPFFAGCRRDGVLHHRRFRQSNRRRHRRQGDDAA